VSVERGIDPRDCVLMPFGGGGPLHCCGLAEQLGMRTIFVPPHAGVLSALGLAIAPDRRSAAASVMAVTDALLADDIARLADALAVRATARRGVASTNGLDVRWTARARYVGQGHELDVPFRSDAPPRSVADRFASLHVERYGFTLDRPVEIVSARCTASTAARAVRLARRGAGTWDGSMRDDGTMFDATVRGHATVELPDATLLVVPGWEARALPIGGWIMERLT
jgi:N-methylhydantoinase A